MLTRTAAYPSPELIQSYVAKAHRMRAQAFTAFVARLFRRSAAAPNATPTGRLAAA